MRETYSEALVLIGVSLAVVFAVLWILFLLIRFMRNAFGRLKPPKAEEGSTERDKHVMILTGAQPEDPSQEDDFEEEPVDSQEEMRSMSDGLDALTRAAIISALAAYMSSEAVSGRPMFLRGITGSGARGRMARKDVFRGSGSHTRYLGSKGGCGSCVDSK
jgi:Na+-transporting methylmalonyl-CoA/oxaloacetate decarboxylase gamma subunit